MYKLRALGRIELVRGSGAPVHSVLSQPKRIALLTYLASSSEDFCSRDRLVEVFWPELDSENARHALSQAVYFLRRSLGKHTVVSTDADRLRISTEHVECDVRLFLEALEEERHEEALRHYRGDFLQDFLRPDLPVFQRWVDEAQVSLRARARDAAIHLSERAEASGDGKAAHEWARKAVDLAPLEERPLRRLLSSLRMVGDRARALAIYEDFQARLQEELDARPSAATQALVESITTADADPRGLKPREETLVASTPLPAQPPWEPGGQGEDIEPAAAGSGAGEAGFRKLLTLSIGPASLSGWAVALVLGLAIAFSGRGDGSDPSEAAPADETRLAVLPFSFQGSEQYAYLAAGVAELLNIGLAELEPLRMVNPRAVVSVLDPSTPAGLSAAEGDRVARRFGAEFYVTGSVIEIGGRLEVIAYLHRQGGELVATLREHTTDEAELFEVVDDLVRGLVALGHLPAGSWLGRTAAATTHSFPALRAFLQGEDRYRRGQYDEAMSALEEAVDLDPSFALAYYRGALSALWIGAAEFDVAREWTRAAVAHKDRLPEQEQLLIRALDAFLAGRPLRAERLYRQILAAQPENIEAWFSLGEVLFHYGPGMGRKPSRSKQAWGRVLEVQPDHRGALFHLALIAASEGDVKELTDVLRRLEAVDPARPPPLSVQALLAWATEDREAQGRILERARDEPSRSVHWAAEYLARYLHEIPGALEMARILADAAGTPEERVDAHFRVALLELARGRIRAAATEIEAAEAVDPEMAAVHRAYLTTFPEALVELRALTSTSKSPGSEDPPGVPPVRAAMPRLPVASGSPEGGFRGLLSEGERAQGPDADLRWYLAGLLAAGGAPGPSAVQVAEGIARLEAIARGTDPAFPLSRSLAQALRAEGALRGQRRTEALEGLQTLFQESEMWYEMTRVSPLYAMARERFLLAGLLRETGDSEKALSWYRSLVRSTVGEAPLLGPSWLRIAEIHEARGEFAEADELYRNVLELWDEADPELAAAVAEIRARVESRSDLVAGQALRGPLR